MEIATILLFAFPILVGALLFYIASWARKKNIALNAKGETTRQQALAAWRDGQIRRGFEIYYLGNLPTREARVATALSVVVLVVVSASLIVLLVAVFGK